MGRPLNDLSNKIFGNLTVVNRYTPYKVHPVLWKTICSCGNERILPGSDLTRGRIKHCGCKTRENRKLAGKRRRITKEPRIRKERPYIEMVGKIFGNLLVISRGKQSSRKEFYWLCRCNCGKEYEVRGSHLRKNSVKKCRACAGKDRRVENPISGYPAGFSLDLRKRIRRRDNHTCQYCSTKCKYGELDVHHIDHDRSNNDKSNLISLCNNCHYMCHGKDSTKWVEYWQNYMKLLTTSESSCIIINITADEHRAKSAAWRG